MSLPIADNRFVSYSPPFSVTPSASPFTYTNTTGRIAAVIVSGGTVSSITIIHAGNSIQPALTSGTFILDLMDQLTISYTSVPSVAVIPIL